MNKFKNKRRDGRASSGRGGAVRSALLALVAAAGLVAGARAESIKISCGAVGRELEQCREAAQAWAKKTGNQVQVVATPNDSSERLALYEQVLSSGSDKIDVFQVDVVWPGLLGSHFIDLRSYTHGAEQQMFPDFVAADTKDGRLVAMPWFINAGLLFYRSHLRPFSNSMWHLCVVAGGAWFFVAITHLRPM